MKQKILLLIILIGLLFAAYMAFFADKRGEMTDEALDTTTEEPTTSAGVIVAESDTAEYFATKDGMALYTFTKDDFNVSNCSGRCLVEWPAFHSDELLAADGFGTITRQDGTPQSTYLEKPLYTYYKDTKPGDTKGHKVHGSWFLATFSK